MCSSERATSMYSLLLGKIGKQYLFSGTAPKAAGNPIFYTDHPSCTLAMASEVVYSTAAAQTSMTKANGRQSTMKPWDARMEC